MVGLKDVDISLKGFGIAEVVCANDVDIGLNDFGTADVVQVNLFSKVIFVKGLEASLELLLTTQENLMIKTTLEDNAPMDG